MNGVNCVGHHERRSIRAIGDLRWSGGVAACSYAVGKYECVFLVIRSAEKENQVTAPFRPPPVRESANMPFLRYAKAPCNLPLCRATGGHPIRSGIGALLGEFGADEKGDYVAYRV